MQHAASKEIETLPASLFNFEGVALALSLSFRRNLSEAILFTGQMFNEERNVYGLITRLGYLIYIVPGHDQNLANLRTGHIGYILAFSNCRIPVPQCRKL